VGFKIFVGFFWWGLMGLGVQTLSLAVLQVLADALSFCGFRYVVTGIV
jgi:hypothetical protein